MTPHATGRKVALVTGARRGIGRATALELARQGFDLVLNDVVDDAAAQQTLADVQAAGAQARFLQGDIADLATHTALTQLAYDTFGRLDSLVNNAGIQVRNRGDLMDVTPERFDEMMAINLRGTFFMTQHVAQRMLADGQPTAGRSIVLITSANARLVSIEKSEYCVSKTGLSMTAKLFAVRLAEAGIGVFEIRPGLIRTDMTAAVRDRYGQMIEDGLSPVRRWGEPEDIAQSVATLVLGKLPFATGVALDIDGGLMLPRL